MSKAKYISFMLLIIFSSFIINACKDASPVSTETARQSSVSLIADMPVGSTGIVIDKAKFLVEQLNIRGEGEVSEINIVRGPIVVSVDLLSQVTPMGVTMEKIPNATYTNVNFKIHEMSGSEPPIDPDIVAGTSGIITGTYNGVSFTYITSITATQNSPINPPLVISEPVANVAVNATMVVSPKMWFEKNGVTLDPNDPSNKTTIDENIRASFINAFEDNNKDGVPD